MHIAVGDVKIETEDQGDAGEMQGGAWDTNPAAAAGLYVYIILDNKHTEDEHRAAILVHIHALMAGDARLLSRIKATHKEPIRLLMTSMSIVFTSS